MRRWSRAVALLCIVYVVALLLFHRQLDPSDDVAITNDDYMNGRGDLQGPAMPHMVTAINDSVAIVPHIGPLDLKRQLKTLEVGMTKLEKQISNVKQMLAEEGTARAKSQQRKERDGNNERDQREDENEPKVIQLQQGNQRQPLEELRERREVWQREREQNMLGGQDERQQDRRPVVYFEQGRNDNARWMQQRRQQERFIRQPGKGRPVAFPLHPDGIMVYGNPNNGLGQGNRARVIGGAEAEGGAPQPEEDYTNSSLVKIGEGVAAYAAYHDDRTANKPFVRVIMILSATKENRRALCHFHSSDFASSFTVDAAQYELCENHKKKYLGFIYSCPVPLVVARSAYNLSLSLNHSAAVKVPLPVQHVTPQQVREGQVSIENHRFKYNFSVCVSPLFGSVLAKRLIEFLELTRLLGVHQVFFYDFQMSSVIKRVIRYYQDRGWVTLLPWRLPKTMDTAKIWYHGQLVTNNDCLYRSMAVSAYTAFHDIDELIVPHAQGIKSLGELFPPVLPNDTCGYAFKSAFYDPGVTEGQFPEDLQSVALTARPAMFSRIRTKVMVAPRRVFEVGIHHISKQYEEHWLPKQYDPNLAYLHHYRDCIRDFGMRCENWVKDTTIKDKYLPELRDNFQEVLRTLGL